MNSSILLVIAGCFLLVNSLPSVSLGDLDVRSGNCSNPNPYNLVHSKHIHKTRIPFTVREASDEWHGDKKIYCVKAISLKDSSKGSSAWIKEGGANHTYVTIEMESGRGHGLEYNITVYAR